MQSPYPVASILGSLMFLLRHEPAATADHAALLEALRAVRHDEALRLAAHPDGLRVNDRAAALDAPSVSFISEQMLLHGIQALTLPAALPDPSLIRLLTVLSAFPGTYAGFREVLHALGDVARQVDMTRLTGEFEVFRSLGQRAGPDLPSEPPAGPAPGQDLEIRRSVADDFQRTQEVSLEPRSSDAELASLLSGGTTPAEREGLEPLAARGRAAANTGDWNGLLDVCVQLMEGESEAQSDLLGSSYRIELRRLLPQHHLRMMARLTHGDRKQEAIAVLKRFGPDATDLLMELLIAAPTIGERRSYYSAITQINQGNEFVIQYLSSAEWFAVRNAANICGELELAEAVPALVRQAQHADERVRKAVADALGRISTPAALDGLRKLVADPVAGVRSQAVMHLNGRRARGMARPVGEMLRKEEDEGARQEALLALGRIGTPEALTILSDWAAPGGKLLARKQVAVRLQAVRGLALAGPAATDALAGLQRDEAPEIRAAASAALDALKP